MEINSMADVPRTTLEGQTMYSVRHVKKALNLKFAVRQTLKQLNLPYTRADFELETGVRRFTAINGAAVVALAEKFCKGRVKAIKDTLNFIEQM